MAVADKQQRHSLAAPVVRTSPSTPPGAAPALPRIPSMTPIGGVDKEKARLSLSVDRPWPFGGDPDAGGNGLLSANGNGHAVPTSPADEAPPAKRGGLGRSTTMKSPLSILRRKWPGFSVMTHSDEPKDEDGRALSSRPSSLEIRTVPRQPSPSFRLVDLAAAQAQVVHDRPPTPPEKDKRDSGDSRSLGHAQVVKVRRRSNVSLQSPRQLGLVPHSPTPSLSCESATAASILGADTPDSSPRPSIEILPGSLGVEVEPVDRLIMPPQRTSSLDRVDTCECSICLRSKGKLIGMRVV